MRFSSLIVLATLVALARADEGPNLIRNGDFEADAVGGATFSQTITDWSTRGDADADVVVTTFGEGREFRPGRLHLRHARFAGTTPIAYRVFTSQLVHHVPDGLYTARAWVNATGPHHRCRMEVRRYGGEPLFADCPSGWTQVAITGIPVTSGRCLVGFRSVARAGGQLLVDDVELVAEEADAPSGVARRGSALDAALAFALPSAPAGPAR